MWILNFSLVCFVIILHDIAAILTQPLPREPQTLAPIEATLFSRYLVVDKHSRGAFRTVQEAINAIPQGNNQWVHIYIHAGYYIEKVSIPYDKPYIVMQGEGLMRTVISWSDTATLYGTANSATFTANAPNFVAKGIGFMNAAPPPPPGAYGGQAVAVLLQGDMMAFYDCGFHGAQDTLFDYEGRHYFMNCFIEGSIDFIFGHGRSIYKGCTLLVRAQAGYVSGSITAQNRDNPQDNSGFIFMNCTIIGTGDVYLGRAWGAYSRVIFMYTYMSSIVSPQGWDDWGDTQRQRTVFYGQYKCSGPGSNPQNRVPWSHDLDDIEAQPFLQIASIDACEWLPKI